MPYLDLQKKREVWLCRRWWSSRRRACWLKDRQQSKSWRWFCISFMVKSHHFFFLSWKGWASCTWCIKPAHMRALEKLLFWEYDHSWKGKKKKKKKQFWCASCPLKELFSCKEWFPFLGSVTSNSALFSSFVRKQGKGGTVKSLRKEFLEYLFVNPECLANSRHSINVKWMNKWMI